MLALAVSMALVYQLPQGFADRTAAGRTGLGPLASKVTLPSRATIKRISVDEHDGRVRAASWAFTLPTEGTVGPSFLDQLAGGIAELGKKAAGADLAVVGKQSVQVQGTPGGRVDVDMNVDATRMRETIYYAPADNQVAVLVYLCPLSDLPHYQPLFEAAAQSRPPPFPLAKLLEAAAILAFLAALWGARAARKRLQSAVPKPP